MSSNIHILSSHICRGCVWRTTPRDCKPVPMEADFLELFPSGLFHLWEKAFAIISDKLFQLLVLDCLAWDKNLNFLPAIWGQTLYSQLRLTSAWWAIRRKSNPHIRTQPLLMLGNLVIVRHPSTTIKISGPSFKNWIVCHSSFCLRQ